MKWQRRVHVAAGPGCRRTMLYLLVAVPSVVGWVSKALVHVGAGLCALYCVTVVMVLMLQCHLE